MVKTVTFLLSTSGTCDLHDITDRVAMAVRESGVDSGIVTVFVPGSTAGITTLEYEPGAVKDFQELMERILPTDSFYYHNERWGDGNGFSHIRAAITGPSLAVPFQEASLLLGTWQQIQNS